MTPFFRIDFGNGYRFAEAAHTAGFALRVDRQPEHTGHLLALDRRAQRRSHRARLKHVQVDLGKILGSGLAMQHHLLKPVKCGNARPDPSFFLSIHACLLLLLLFGNARLDPVSFLESLILSGA